MTPIEREKDKTSLDKNESKKSEVSLIQTDEIKKEDKTHKKSFLRIENSKKTEKPINFDASIIRLKELFTNNEFHF